MSHHNQQLQINSSTLIEIGGTYIRKMAGVDFLVKLLGYIIRFKILSLAANPATAQSESLIFHKKLLGSIVESRMLSNAGKSTGTFLSATKLAETPEDFSNPENNTKIPASRDCGWLPGSLSCVTKASPVKLASYAALLCRTVEQVSSDSGYLSRYIFTTWNRDMLTKEYKRWKSLSLTCLLFVELSYLFRYIQQRMEKRRNLKNNNGVVSSPVSSNGTNEDDSALFSPDSVSPARSNGASSHNRSVSTVEFEKAKGVEELHRIAIPSSHKYKYRFQHLAAGTTITQLDAINSLIVTVRCVCDMYIYYRWIPSWNPPEFLQYSAGVVSAILGIYLVMEETISDVKKNHQQQQKQLGSKSAKEMAKIVDERKNGEDKQ